MLVISFYKRKCVYYVKAVAAAATTEDESKYSLGGLERINRRPGKSSKISSKESEDK